MVVKPKTVSQRLTEMYERQRARQKPYPPEFLEILTKDPNPTKCPVIEKWLNSTDEEQD